MCDDTTVRVVATVFIAVVLWDVGKVESSHSSELNLSVRSHCRKGARFFFFFFTWHCSVTSWKLTQTQCTQSTYSHIKSIPSVFLLSYFDQFLQIHFYDSLKIVLSLQLSENSKMYLSEAERPPEWVPYTSARCFVLCMQTLYIKYGRWQHPACCCKSSPPPLRKGICIAQIFLLNILQPSQDCYKMTTENLFAYMHMKLVILISTV